MWGRGWAWPGPMWRGARPRRWSSVLATPACLQAVCGVGEAEAKNQELAVINHVKKTDFTLVKLKQYLKDVQRGQAVLAKHGELDYSEET